MKVNPKTNPNNIIYFKDYRISVLKEGVIRVEKSDDEFNDYPTQKVLNRNFEQVYYSYAINDEFLEVILRNYKFIFNGNIDDFIILYNGDEIKLNKRNNLGGTYETVDGMDGDRQTYAGGINYEIGDGICSKDGLAVLNDEDSYCFDENLNFSHINPDSLDAYIFFYPNDYIGAVRDFFELSGYPPKLPKYVFGNWWSRFYAYSQKKYLYLMDSFAYNNVPFTVATVDMDWHYSPSNGRNVIKDLEMDEEEFIKNPNATIDKYYCKGWVDSNDWSKGWTGYTWNKKLFPDYEQFLKDLHDRGLHVTLNLHPADGINFYEDLYKRCAERIGFNYSSKESIPFDFTNEENKKMYCEEVLNFYEKKGVDFWWIDWQQGSFSKFPSLTPMWLCNHYFYLDRAKHTNRPLILSRCCGAGGHRYPLGFSGDSFQTFASLKYLIKTTPQASNIGFSYWSHDIGGHMHGFKDGDLFSKFVQFGVFSPVVRIHSSCNEMFSKEPSLFLNGYGEIINKYLRLRHQMIPYIYSYSLRTNMDGKALIEPLYYHHPLDEKAFEYADIEYYFANDLLVAPISERKNADDLNIKDVYFPKGVFYDYKYGYKYSGNKEVKVIRETGDMPVFIKEGSFFVLDHNNIGNSIENPKHLNIITTFGNGEYKFFEDDNNDKMITTTFKNSNRGIIRIKVTGDKDLFVKDRLYTFKLLNVFDCTDVVVSNANVVDVCNESGYLEITLSNLDFKKEVVLKYNFKKLNKHEHAIKAATIRLSYIDDSNDIRDDLYNKICASKNYRELVSIIKKSKLKQISIDKLLEVITL